MALGWPAAAAARWHGPCCCACTRVAAAEPSGCASAGRTSSAAAGEPAARQPAPGNSRCGVAADGAEFARCGGCRGPSSCCEVGGHVGRQPVELGLQNRGSEGGQLGAVYSRQPDCRSAAAERLRAKHSASRRQQRQRRHQAADPSQLTSSSSVAKVLGPPRLSEAPRPRVLRFLLALLPFFLPKPSSAARRRPGRRGRWSGVPQLGAAGAAAAGGSGKLRYRAGTAQQG